jgi:hypothetical protein
MRHDSTFDRHAEALEQRLAFDATWVVISPGVGEVVVQQTVPLAAVEGLVTGATQANEGAVGGANCWLVRFDEPTAATLTITMGSLEVFVRPGSPHVT